MPHIKCGTYSIISPHLDLVGVIINQLFVLALVVTYAVVKGSNYIWKIVRINRFAKKYQNLQLFQQLDIENDKHIYHK